MSYRQNFLPAMAIVLAASLIGMFFFIPKAHANPGFYSDTAQTATATTTVSYMTVGTATTTVIYDTYSSGRNQSADRAALQVQFTASSTGTTLNVAYEYALGGSGLDCAGAPTSCDWYRDDLTNYDIATTSQIFNANSSNSFNWTFASSSQAAAGIATTNNRALKIFSVPTPTRYIRAIFTITGTNGGVWAQFVPVKQSS